jgi:hypothetical protein
MRNTLSTPLLPLECHILFERPHSLLECDIIYGRPLNTQKRLIMKRKTEQQNINRTF